MDFVHLRYFLAVARHGSFTAAAKALHVGQSTLSEAVRALEEELGTTLFLRTRTGVMTTEAGALLVDRVDGLLASVDQIGAEIQELEKGDVGRFVLGCHPALGGYFLPRFMADFLVRYPRIELDLWNRTSAEVRQAVIDREVHFGLVVNTVPHPDLVIVDAYRDVIQVFGLEPPLPSLEAASDLLQSSRLVYPTRQPFEGLVQRLVAAGLAPARLLPCGELGLARSLALGGIGLAVLPRRVAQDGPEELFPVHEELPRFDDTIHLVYRGDLHRTKAAMRLRDALLAHARSL